MALRNPETVFTFKCNLCWEPISSTSYKSVCHHIFCENCAFQHFGQQQNCPACGRVLGEQDFTEFIVGMESSSLEQVVLQDVLQNPAWESSLARSVKVLRLGQSVIEFALTQMFLSQQRNTQASSTYEQQVETLRRDTSKQIVQLKSDLAAAQQKQKQCDLRLIARDREFNDLQTAYREKSRKCQAWEKAYNALRGQPDGSVSNVQGTGLVTPPLGGSSRLSMQMKPREDLHPPRSMRTPDASPSFQLQSRADSTQRLSPSPKLMRTTQVYRGPIANFRSSPQIARSRTGDALRGASPGQSSVRRGSTDGLGHYPTSHSTVPMPSPLVQRSLGRPTTPLLNFGGRR